MAELDVEQKCSICGRKGCTGCGGVKGFPPQKEEGRDG